MQHSDKTKFFKCCQQFKDAQWIDRLSQSHQQIYTNTPVWYFPCYTFVTTQLFIYWPVFLILCSYCKNVFGTTLLFFVKWGLLSIFKESFIECFIYVVNGCITSQFWIKLIKNVNKIWQYHLLTILSEISS